MRVAKACIAAMPPSAELVGDKGYCSNDLRAWLAERGTQAVIPNKRNRRLHHPCNPEIYKQRNVVERMFVASKTGDASPHASTETSKTSCQPSLSRLPSSGGLNESEP
jgi:transposase